MFGYETKDIPVMHKQKSSHLNNFEDIRVRVGSNGESPTHHLVLGPIHHLGVLVGGSVDVGHLHAVLGQRACLVRADHRHTAWGEKVARSVGSTVR